MMLGVGKLDQVGYNALGWRSGGSRHGRVRKSVRRDCRQRARLAGGANGAPRRARVIIVESYRSQLTAIDSKGVARQLAYVAGAPNACVLGSDGLLYVCQNGGTTGPWRAAEMTTPSIQRVAEGGEPEILLTEVAGIKPDRPNDLVFAADRRTRYAD